MFDLAIRTAVMEDLPALAEIFRRASLENTADAGVLLAHPDALELSDVAIGDGRTRVAVADGRVVGFATTHIVDDAMEIEDMFVHPEWTRRGVGSTLVLDITMLARANGVRRVEVTANTAALAFYEANGFVASGEAKTRFGPAPRMRLDVPPNA